MAQFRPPCCHPQGAPASVVRIVARLLHLNVENRARVTVLVTVNSPGGLVKIGETVPVHIDQDPVDRRRAIPSQQTSWPGPSR